MPTVPKTSPQHILREARRLVARGGAEAFSLKALAEAVGVQAPSLYKHFEDRSAILRAVAAEVSRELAGKQLQAAGEGRVEERLKAVARAQRDYARRQPHLYALVFNPAPGEALPAEQASSGPLEALLALLEQWMGKGHVLEGARLLVAFTHGFAMMEGAAAFQLGGDVDEAFEFGLGRVVESLRRGP
jgi:AcrR family transcriptional regulator